MSKLDREELKRRLEFSERKRTLLHRMLSRRGTEEDTFLWTIADLMTLLLLFFILFYNQAAGRTVSDTKEPATEPSLERIERASYWDTEEELPEAPPVGESPSEPTNSPEAEKKDESLEALVRDVMNEVGEADDQAFTARWDNRRLVFVLGERITFHVGKAELLEEFQPTLRRIADFIASKERYRVAVSGHTDDTPIHTDQFPSNWELSAARASRVARFLIENSVNPQHLSIRGYSSYRPRFENTSPEGRQGNRRVEITLIKEDDETTI
jgi:chemotaxis protein MotB